MKSSIAAFGRYSAKQCRSSNRHIVHIILLFFALLLLAAGITVLWMGRRMWQNTGLPTGQVVYSDTGAEQAIFEPLVSHRFGLVGKPDYLVEIAGPGGPLRVPLEVKSRKRPAVPAEGHILQLGAYCLIVEDVYGQRPTHGYLRYADATVQIPFTDALRTQVLNAASQLRGARTAFDVRRSHEEPGRCMNCGYRASCGPPALGGN
jgi:CRISPR-associated exonuclease Cas4